MLCMYNAFLEIQKRIQISLSTKMQLEFAMLLRCLCSISCWQQVLLPTYAKGQWPAQSHRWSSLAWFHCSFICMSLSLGWNNKYWSARFAQEKLIYLVVFYCLQRQSRGQRQLEAGYCWCPGWRPANLWNLRLRHAVVKVRIYCIIIYYRVKIFVVQTKIIHSYISIHMHTDLWMMILFVLIGVFL